MADLASDDNEDTGAAFVADETEFNIFNTDRKLQGLEQASRMLAALPEKKSLIYFAGGVSKTGVDNQAQLEATVTAASKANVAFYPVDTRGLIGRPSRRRRGQRRIARLGLFHRFGLQLAAQQHQQLAGDAGHAGRRYEAILRIGRRYRDQHQGRFHAQFESGFLAESRTRNERPQD